MHISRRNDQKAVAGMPRELSNGSDSFTGASGASRGDSRPADVGGYQVKSHLATCGLRMEIGRFLQCSVIQVVSRFYLVSIDVRAILLILFILVIAAACKIF